MRTETENGMENKMENENKSKRQVEVKEKVRGI
jgi:hypothetical protein